MENTKEDNRHKHFLLLIFRNRAHRDFPPIKRGHVKTVKKLLIFNPRQLSMAKSS